MTDSKIVSYVGEKFIWGFPTPAQEKNPEVFTIEKSEDPGFITVHGIQYSEAEVKDQIEKKRWIICK